MITKRMKGIFGYKMHLWDITQFTPFKWNQKSQLVQPSVLWRFLLWIDICLPRIILQESMESGNQNQHVLFQLWGGSLGIYLALGNKKTKSTAG